MGDEHTLTTNEAQSNRQEYQRMQRRPDNEREPHAEVVDLEDLAASESQHEHAEKLGDSDTREDGRSNINESSPSTSRAAAASELSVGALEDRGRRDGESARDVGADRAAPCRSGLFGRVRGPAWLWRVFEAAIAAGSVQLQFSGDG